MNETLQTIANRRSCREFTDKLIPIEVINQILEAGTKAPSALNKQSASILCIINNKIVEDLRKKLIDFVGKDPLYGAKVIIIVYADKESRFAFQDGSCVLQNLFLAATSLGVGSCWINCLHDYFATEEGNQFKKKVLQLNDNAITIGTCVIGYHAKKMFEKEKKNNYIKVI